MPLKTYRGKRRFGVTPEPRGGGRVGAGLRFVIQEHHARRLHYDFRLEHHGVLVSWAIPKGPSMNPTEKRLAVHVEDHPLAYRTFQGTIPAGEYGAGQVSIWDAGTYRVPGATTKADSQKRLAAGLRKGHVQVILQGQRIHGLFHLVNMHRDAKSWLIIKGEDAAASREDIESDTGVSEVPDLAGQKKTTAPKQTEVMLASLTDRPFDRRGWLFEIKWDGFRAIARKVGKNVDLQSRNHKSFVDRFPRVVDALRNIDHDFVVDGEVVLVDANGKSVFQEMQNIDQWKPGHGTTLQYQVFDLLWLDGHDLRSMPLRQRKELLAELIPKRSAVRFSDHVSEHGRDFFQAAQRQGLEGIMAKDAQSPYRQGVRGQEWLKIKIHARQEAVIAGFTAPRRSREFFGALVLGVYERGQFKYIGHTGTGFTHSTLSSLMRTMKPLVTSVSPFSSPPKTNAPVTWLKPKLVCEISFAGWTGDGRMRQPVFMGLRDDKAAKDVHQEIPQPSLAFHPDQPAKKKTGHQTNTTFGLTHLDKVYFPKDRMTKGDIIAYYRQVAPVILPYLKNRPENLLRHPNGISQPGFFHKDVGTMPPSWVKTERIYSESNRKWMHYLVCQNLETLLYMANLGCIEINPWSSRVQHLDKPDWLVIDLDPEGVKFPAVIETANVVHEVLEDLEISSYPKTSGKRGIHIFIPLQARYGYDQVKDLSELLVNIIHQQSLPNLTSIVRLPSQRNHRVYLDWLQNHIGQTLAAPYSVRPVPGATVSTPLRWAEVKPGLDPKKFTIRTIQRRLDRLGDLFRPVLGSGIDLPAVLTRIEQRYPTPTMTSKTKRKRQPR